MANLREEHALHVPPLHEGLAVEGCCHLVQAQRTQQPRARDGAKQAQLLSVELRLDLVQEAACLLALKMELHSTHASLPAIVAVLRFLDTCRVRWPVTEQHALHHTMQSHACALRSLCALACTLMLAI